MLLLSMELKHDAHGMHELEFPMNQVSGLVQRMQRSGAVEANIISGSQSGSISIGGTRGGSRDSSGGGS